GEDVALACEAIAHAVSGPAMASRAGVSGGGTVEAGEADLALLSCGIVRYQPRDRLRGRRPVAHEAETAPAIGGVGERLRRDGAGAGLGPRHDAADSEKLRGDGHADVAGGAVYRRDGERRDIGLGS